MDKQVQNIRSQSSGGESGNSSSNDSLLKTLICITYAFPSFSLDTLTGFTITQIQWLYNDAAKAINYQVKAQAYAAGNIKKLDFFLK